MSVATAPSRVARYLDEPRKNAIILPTSPEGRAAALSDAVFAAVLALQGQLTHPDPAVVQAAAGMILDLEMTRLRHSRPVSGTHRPALAPLAPLAPLVPPPAAKKVDHADPLEVFVEQVRREPQAEEDEDGAGVVVSRGQAEERARGMLDRTRRPGQPRRSPPGRPGDRGDDS